MAAYRDRKRALGWGMAAWLLILLLLLVIWPTCHLDNDVVAVLVTVISITLGLLGVFWQQGPGNTAEDDLVGRAREVLREKAELEWQREARIHQLASDETIAVYWHKLPSQAQHRGFTSDTVVRLTKPRRVVELVQHLADRGDSVAISRAWRRLRTKQMVIVGPPGSGKTSLTVILVNDLVAQRKRALQAGKPFGTADDPVPVLFPLGAWNLNRYPDLDTWLAEWITHHYPIPVGPMRKRSLIAAQLIENGGVLPILDGLDDVPPQRIEQAIAAINRSDQARRSMIITCRAEEYQDAAIHGRVPLRSASVIMMDPVQTRDAKKYLLRDDPQEATRWAPVLDRLAHSADSNVAKVLGSPLMLFLARSACGHPSEQTSPDLLVDEQRFQNPEALREYLFEGLIPSVYREHAAEPRPRWNTAQATRWLSFLARHLGEGGTLTSGDLAWWRLRQLVPRWLPAVTVGEVAGLGYGLVVGLGERLNVHAGIGLLPGVLACLLVGESTRRCFAGGRVFRWHRPGIGALGGGLGGGSGGGLGGGSGGALGGALGGGSSPAARWSDRPGAGLAGGCLGGLLGALLAGFAGTRGFGHASGLTAAFPAGLGVGIWAGPALGFYGGTAGSAVGGFVAGLLVEVGKGGWTAGAANGLAVALGTGLAVARGGNALPAVGVRWSRIGLLASGGLALAGWIATTPLVGIYWGALLGIAVAVITALVAGMASGGDTVTGPAGPLAVLARDRKTAAAIGTTFGVVGLVVGALIAGTATVASHSGLRQDPITTAEHGVAVGAAVGLGLGLVFAFTQTAWGTFTVTRLWLVARRRMPLRIMSFLSDAHERGILRQMGATHQFRHEQLQRYLAHREPDPS